MSHMKGDLITKTRKLVKCLAKPEPKWLKAMELAPPVTFARCDGKLNAICLPEDKYVTKFYAKHPDAKHEDPIKFNSFNPVPARVFACRVLELTEQGINEEAAMAAADMQYRTEMNERKQAYARLKKIAKIQGKKPAVPNPYPSAIRQIQAEERKFVQERFTNPEILKRVEELQAARLVECWRRSNNNHLSIVILHLEFHHGCKSSHCWFSNFQALALRTSPRAASPFVKLNRQLFSLLNFLRLENWRGKVTRQNYL